MGQGRYREGGGVERDVPGGPVGIRTYFELPTVILKTITPLEKSFEL